MSINRAFAVIVTMIITGGALLCVAILFIQDKEITRLKAELATATGDAEELKVWRRMTIEPILRPEIDTLENADIYKTTEESHQEYLRDLPSSEIEVLREIRDILKESRRLHD